MLWGGRNTANITGMCAECSQCLGHTRFAPTHSMCAFPVYTAQAPGCSAGELSKQALGFVHFSGLRHSGSGSWVLHKGTDLIGPAFCALSSSKQLCRPGAWQAHSLQVGGASYHLPGPSPSVSCMCSGSAVSGVPCVSFGSLTVTLLADVNHPGSQMGACSQFGGGCPSLFSSGCCPSASASSGGRGQSAPN